MELQLEGFQREKPTNRGKFSPDRDVWEKIHQQRYLQWQLGDSMEQIARDEGVTYNAVKHSVSWVEARLPRAEVLAGRNTRVKLITLERLTNRYIDELERLMSDENPIVRSKALEHFRKTVALEQQSGVQVNTQINVSSNHERYDFETEIARIRAEQKKAWPEASVESTEPGNQSLKTVNGSASET